MWNFPPRNLGAAKSHFTHRQHDIAPADSSDPGSEGMADVEQSETGRRGGLFTGMRPGYSVASILRPEGDRRAVFFIHKYIIHK